MNPIDIRHALTADESDELATAINRDLAPQLHSPAVAFLQDGANTLAGKNTLTKNARDVSQ